MTTSNGTDPTGRYATMLDPLTKDQYDALCASIDATVHEFDAETQTRRYGGDYMTRVRKLQGDARSMLSMHLGYMERYRDQAYRHGKALQTMVMTLGFEKGLPREQLAVWDFGCALMLSEDAMIQRIGCSYMLRALQHTSGVEALAAAAYAELVRYDPAILPVASSLDDG